MILNKHIDRRKLHQHTTIWVLAIVVSLIPIVALVLSSEPVSAKPTPRFVTWNGSGPDKWASIWLVERFISPGTVVELVEENRYVADATMFDVPDSHYLRSAHETTFEKLKSAWIKDEIGEPIQRLKSKENLEALDLMRQILHDIEVNTWQPDQLAVSNIVEQAYRELQNEFQREAIPRQCYMALYDQLADQLLLGGLSAIVEKDSIRPQRNCLNNNVTVEAQPLVAEITPSSIAQYIRRGQSVVFVDVREQEEFNEVRIPGARNIQIRNFNQSIADELAGADLIVSYCVKDFRGYEMALKIAKAGFSNSVIMNPYGIKGWITAGLPVYKGEGSEAELINTMHECLLGNGSCLRTIAKQSGSLTAEKVTVL